MSETLKGKGIVWGIGGTLTMAKLPSGTIIDSSDMAQSEDFAWQSEKEEIRSGTGEPGAIAYYNPTKTVTVTVIPSAASIADAKTSMDEMLLLAGTGAAITDPASSIVGAPANYIVEQTRLRRTNTGAALIEMDLIKYGTDLSTTISA